MPFPLLAAAIAGVGGGLAIKGFFDGQDASRRTQQAQAEITQASIRAEQLRRQAMELEAQRRTRDAIRQFQIARATAVSNGASSGASLSSSGVQGGIGQITGLMGQSVLAQAENFGIGQGLFSANIDKMNAEFSLSRARTDQQSAQGMMSLGTSLMSNATGISNNVTSLFGGPSPGTPTNYGPVKNNPYSGNYIVD